MKRMLLHFYVLSIVLISMTGCTGYADGNKTASNTNKLIENQSPDGRVLRYGIFSPVSGGTVIESEQTSTGKALSNMVMTFIRETKDIPIKKDRLLAYQYRLSNIPENGYVELRRVLKHPSFTRPDGTVTTGSDYIIKKKVQRNEVFAYDVYGLNESYEMVEGDWTFQIWYQDKKLIEQKFTTYWSEQKET